MIKKGIILLVSLFLLLGCTSTENNSDSILLYGQAQGKNGLIEVELFIEEGELKHIEVLQHNETPGFDQAMIEIIDQIMMKKSIEVDFISGATETSDGILRAIENAADKYPSPLFTETIKQEQLQVECELLIVGGGGAGFSAAIEAMNQGFTDVRVIEKMPFGGGNTRMSGGEFAVANNELQAQKGIQDSKELFFNDIYEGGGKLGKPELIQLIVDNGLENYNWLNQYIGVEYKDTLSWYGGHSVARTLWPQGDGAKMIDLLIQKALKLGVKVDYNTRAYEFITDANSKVIGVKASYNNQTVNYLARNGVILCTGGFGANVEMRMHYDTQWLKLDENIPTTNSPAATGDGILMAEKVHANLIGMEYIQLYPINNPATGNYYYMDYARIISNAILVNEEGYRFVDEKETRDNISRAILNQTNSIAYEIVGQSVIEELGLDEEYMDELLRGMEQGVIVMGTLEECANHFNLPYNTLQKTLEHYDAMVKNGVDTDFGRTQQLKPIQDDHYLMFSSIVSVHHTMGGVEINENAQVLDIEGNIIPGLYAAGEVTGGIHGNNRLGTLSIPDTVTFGRIAAKSCYKEKMNSDNK